MAPPEPAVSSPAAAETSNTETASVPAEEVEVAVETPAAAEPVEPEAASVAEAEPAAEPPAPPAPTPAVAESEPEPNVPAVQTAALPSVPAPAVESSNDADGRTFGVVNQEARVVIGARADSWVQVLDGEQNVVLTRMLLAGDRYLVPDRNDLVMLTGNAGGLVISVDGKEVPQIGSDGAILHNVRLDVDLLKSGQAVIE